MIRVMTGDCRGRLARIFTLATVGVMVAAGCGERVFEPNLDSRLVGRWVPHAYITSDGGGEPLNPIFMLLEDGSYWERGAPVGEWEVIEISSSADGDVVHVNLSVGVIRYRVAFQIPREDRVRVLTNTSSRGPIGSYTRDGELGVDPG